MEDSTECTACVCEAIEPDVNWVEQFTGWKEELSLIAHTLIDLKGTLENAVDEKTLPRVAMIHGQVVSIRAMLPVLKTVLNEVDGWPEGPRVRKPREKKVVKAKSEKK